MSNSIVYKGVEFKSYKDLYNSSFNKSNTTYGGFHARIRNGVSLEEALNTKAVKYEYEIDGEIFNSKAELVRSKYNIHNLSCAKIGERLLKGWSVEDTLNTPVREYNIIEVTYNGEHFDSIKELVNSKYNKNHIDYGTIRQRLLDGVPEELLFNKLTKNTDNIKLRRTKYQLTAFGVDFNNVKQLVNSNFNKLGLDYNTVRYRISRGWSAEDAISTRSKKAKQQED